MFLRYLLTFFLLFQYTLSVDVDLVLFNIPARDGDGRTVSGLSADNFHVHEDGREQTIKVFQPEDTPATGGLVIDNSGSMMTRRAEVGRAAWAVGGSSQRGQ